jgi:hypothetical protein
MTDFPRELAASRYRIIGSVRRATARILVTGDVVRDIYQATVFFPPRRARSHRALVRQAGGAKGLYEIIFSAML